MKKLTVTILAVLCAMFLFAGCGMNTARNVGSEITSTIDSAKKKTESGLIDSDTNGNTDNFNTSNGRISRDDAKSIAFKHANIREEDAYDIDIDLDEENGVFYYDIDFDTKSAEYDYRIHSTTGEIISSHKENKTSNR